MLDADRVREQRIELGHYSNVIYPGQQYYNLYYQKAVISYLTSVEGQNIEQEQVKILYQAVSDLEASTGRVTVCRGSGNNTCFWKFPEAVIEWADPMPKPE